MPIDQNKIILISGPSGAGEDSVIEGLREKFDFNRVVTTITRQPRLGEREGHPYYFVSVDQFQEMKKNNEFLEWAEVYGDYRGGTKKELERLMMLDKPILWKLDWQGVKTVKDMFPDAVSILIAPSSYEELEERLKKRGKDSSLVIKEREAFTKEWLKHQDIYDHVIINKQGQLDQTIRQTADIIQKALEG